MAKYMCLCGAVYKTKEMSDLHLKMNENHCIFTRSKRARFCDWFFAFNWSRITRFTGAFMVYFVFMNHFKIDLTLLEGVLVSIGIGLYIE